jgi:hypothetical protein
MSILIYVTHQTGAVALVVAVPVVVAVAVVEAVAIALDCFPEVQPGLQILQNLPLNRQVARV